MQDLDPRVRTAKTAELEALKLDVERKARSERERTLAVRYHKVCEMWLDDRYIIFEPSNLMQSISE